MKPRAGMGSGLGVTSGDTQKYASSEDQFSSAVLGTVYLIPRNRPASRREEHVRGKGSGLAFCPKNKSLTFGSKARARHRRRANSQGHQGRAYFRLNINVS